MKLLSEQEQKEHYNATLIGGLLGGFGGIAVGTAGVYAATVRYPAFRQLTLPLRAFLVTSSGTFAAIVTADHYSRAFERKREPDYNYQDSQQQFQKELDAQKSGKKKTLDWLNENRYSVVFGSWVASMGIALGLVGRNPYLTGAQKLVQARVYAQGLTVAVMVISLAFETNDNSKGKGRWETVKVIDPNDPEHKRVIEKQIHHESYAGEDQWRDMVEAEEEKIHEREERHKHEKPAEKKGKETKSGNKNGGKSEKKSDSDDGKAEKTAAKDEKSEESEKSEKSEKPQSKDEKPEKSDTKDKKSEKTKSS